MSQRLETVHDAVIVIVGASRGLGRGVAMMLASKGARVVVADRRKPILDDLVAEIDTSGGTAISIQTDVGDSSEVAKLADFVVSRFGRIDIWVNHMDTSEVGYFWDIPAEEHGQRVDVNLKGLIYGAHAALRHFRAQGSGTLINTASSNCKVPLALQTTYIATRAAVLSLSHSLNDELRRAGEDGIRVETIMPWSVDAPCWYHEANDMGDEPQMATMEAPEIFDAILNACVGAKQAQPVGW